MANRNYPKNISATTAIPFDNPVSAIPTLTVSGAVTFTKVTTGAQVGYGAIRRIIANGTNLPDFSAFKKIGTGDYDNTNGVVNLCIFMYDGTDYNVMFTQPTTISGAGDTTPPAIVLMSVEDADPNKAIVSYGETLDSGSVPANGDYVITVNASARTTTAVNIVSNNVEITFNGAAVVAGDTITIDYTPGTNPIQDAAGNDAVAISGGTVDNNVSGGGGFTWVDLDFPTLQQNVSVTSHVWTPTTDTGWNQKATEDLKLATGTDGAAIHQMQSDAKFGVIGFRTTHAIPGDTTLYTECKVGAYLSAAGAVYSITDGTETLVSGLTLSAGDWLGVFRSGGVWKLRTSTDKTTWTDRATLSPTSFTGIDVYPVLYIYQSSTSPKLYNPQGDGLV